jgi:hypothetical protein
MYYSSKGEQHMAYAVMPTQDPKWQPRKGLEGPFFYANGRVLYYDVKEGQYWDPTTDFYVPNDEIWQLEQGLMDLIARQKNG